MLYKPDEMKNFGIKTDGTSITYKPEYHSPQVDSNVFGGNSRASTSSGSQDHVERQKMKVRKAVDNRRKAKMDKYRQKRLKDVLEREM